MASVIGGWCGSGSSVIWYRKASRPCQQCCMLLPTSEMGRDGGGCAQWWRVRGDDMLATASCSCEAVSVVHQIQVQHVTRNKFLPGHQPLNLQHTSATQHHHHHLGHQHLPASNPRPPFTDLCSHPYAAPHPTCCLSFTPTTTTTG